jgi:hypothetical protein
MDNTADVIKIGNGANDLFGSSVSAAGDVNGDGYDDVIIGARGYNQFTGRAYIFFGGASMDNKEDITMTGEYNYYDFGLAVSSLGDVNNDGYDDVIIGAPGYVDGVGAVFVFLGGPTMDNHEEFWFCGENEFDYYGFSVSNVADINGDGISEWVVGARSAGPSKNGQMKIYQLSARARTHAWLEGPYQPEGNMAQSLFSIGAIPLISPYSDGRKVSAVPSGAVDWVQLELRASAAGPALSKKSVFINTAGDLVEPDGTTTDVTLPALDGSYYLVLRHRNHLAGMSASAMMFTNSPASLFDFSSGLDRWYGTDPNRAVQLGTGVYGMPAGDADGSGTVEASDRSATWNARNQSGYLNADCNLSGTVDASDRSNTWNNRNKSTPVP